MIELSVKAALGSEAPVGDAVVRGWVRTRRDAKGFSFVEINDGSCLANIQAVVDHTPDTAEALALAATGAAVRVRGELAPSPGKGQKWELRAGELEVLGGTDGDYPLQKKRHSDEFLRTIAHLRSRTNKYGAVMRIRSELSFAVHEFFRERGFFYIHTPILTASDCEGAGELFRVGTLTPEDMARDPKGAAERDFFGKDAYLTVSGQLEAEMLALSLGKVYTFGPTFRAENSNTPRHAAEFWMVEPEMAFTDLEGNMDLAEDLVRRLARVVRDRCAEDADLFARFVDKGLEARLTSLAEDAYERMTYTEAVAVLDKSGRKFEYPHHWGSDLKTEHERYLCEEHVGRPVFVYDYPRSLKPFYMRVNDDGKTVAAMDLLAPLVGEIVGGSQREERLGVLEERMAETGMAGEGYWWYLDSRRFGSAPHSGFGLGLERIVMLVTGVGNIRDVIPFPRTPRHIEF